MTVCLCICEVCDDSWQADVPDELVGDSLPLLVGICDDCRSAEEDEPA